MPTSYTDADVDAPAKPKGQFTDGDVDTPQSTPINDSSSMSAGPTGMRRVTDVTDAVGKAAFTDKFPYVHPIDAVSAGTQAIENQIPPSPAKELALGGQSVGKPMGTSSGVLNNPVTNAMAAAPGAASIGSAITSGRPLEAAGDWAASMMRKRATPIQAQFGEAGSIKPIPLVPKDFQPKIPESIVPKGRPGTWTNPGPYNRVPLRINPNAAAPEPGLDLGGSTLSEQTSSGNEGRPATWTNEKVLSEARKGNRVAIAQVNRRGLPMPTNSRYIMGDADYPRTVTNPRETTRFTPEGTPIRDMTKVEKGSKRRIVVP